MKKILGVLVLCLMLVLPFKTLASSKYTSMNLKEVFEQEGIENDLKNYKETDDQITIYLFRGYGCGFCHNFLNFLSSIVDEYGKYFKLESYEVWSDRENSAYMKEISTFLGSEAVGVPYIIIGKEVFPGYSSEFDDSIKKAIKELYNTKKENRYDVIKEYEKSKKEENKSNGGIKFDNNIWLVIGINAAIIVMATAAIIYVMYKENKSLFNKLVSVQQEVNDLKIKTQKVTEEPVKTEAKKTTKKKNS